MAHWLLVPKLRTEFIELFTADTLRRVLLETLVPLAVKWGAVRVANTEPASVKVATEGSDTAASAALKAELALDPYEDFDDYLEMVIQFGYITLFASAFPLAAALSLASNVLELGSDLFKLSFLCRRPPAVRAAGMRRLPVDHPHCRRQRARERH